MLQRFVASHKGGSDPISISVAGSVASSQNVTRTWQGRIAVSRMGGMQMWMFRLPPLVYLIAAPLGLALAVFLFFNDRQNEADKAAARRGKPPAAVLIEKFDPARNTGLAHEVNVVGQVDASRMFELTRGKDGAARERWVMAPVYATTATQPQGPAIGLMMQRGSIDDAQLQKLVVTQGPFGPILLLNGFAVDRTSESEALGEINGRIQLAPNALLIDPFENGREAGLAPSTSGRDSAILVLVIALLVGAFGAFRFFSERNRDKLPDAAPEPIV